MQKAINWDRTFLFIIPRFKTARAQNLSPIYHMVKSWNQLTLQTRTILGSDFNYPSYYSNRNKAKNIIKTELLWNQIEETDKMLNN